MRLSEDEVKCIRLFGKWFSENKSSVYQQLVMDELSLSHDKYVTLIKRMEHIGAIKNFDSTIGYAIDFTISPYVVELVREIDDQMTNQTAQPDIVDQIKQRVRKNPWTAWLIIIFIVLSLLLPFLNSLLELISKLQL